MTRSIALLPLGLFAALIVACASANSTVDQPATTTNVATTSAPVETAAPAYSGPSVVSAPVPEGSPEVCGEIRGRFESTLAAGTGKCKTDADCGCYGSSVSDAHMCGGPTDKETAEKLKTIRREFRTQHCHGTSCKESCTPTCKAGVCSAS